MPADFFFIRRARKSDVGRLADFMAHSYRHAFSDILPMDALASRNADFFAARFSSQWPSVMFAQNNHAACAGLVQVREHHLDLIFVDHRWHGTGIGPALLEAAVAQGAETLECFTCNTRARRFYERAGWSPVEFYRREFAGSMHEFVLYRIARGLAVTRA